MKKSYSFVIALCALLALSACGLKRNLELPDKDKKPAVAEQAKPVESK